MVNVQPIDRKTLIHDGLEFLWHESDISYIVDRHNEGTHYETIAKEMKCKPIEIILVLLHVANEGERAVSPLFKMQTALRDVLGVTRGDSYKVVAKVEKVRKNIATVLKIDGRRYVYEPKGR